MNSTQGASLPPDIEMLIQRYLDGIATEDEVLRLSQMIEIDEAVASCYARLAHLHAMLAADETLRSEAGPLATPASLSPQVNTTGNRPNVLMRWIVTAACALLIVAGVVWWRSIPQRFATVHSAEGVVEVADQSVLYGEWYEFKAGTVELLTARNARLVIEAPAKFRFESAQRLRMTYGRLAADVPPSAKGFTVVMPTGNVVDLGTKFGVDVPMQGDAEIHVFQGEVIAQNSSDGRRRNLTDGDAVLLSADNKHKRSLRSAAFIHPDEVASLHAALAAGQREHSDEASTRLRDDPAVIAVLDFESDDLPEGTYRLVQGRWPGSRAPEFVNQGDHMKLDVGSDRDWQQLTLAAWVRLDRLGAPFQSLLHTDGWNRNNPGQVHWMVTRLNTMRLALNGNTLAPGSDEKHHFPDSRTSVLPEQGRWVHLATVYDSDAGTVRFYLNGQFDKETRQNVAHPARLGPAQIGNWDRQDRKLSGRIDELVLLGRAMSDDELRTLFEAGNPYR